MLVTAQVLPAAYPGVTNTATVASDTPEANPADNTATDEVAVPAQTSLVVTKQSVGTFTAGGTGTYRITVTNNGPTEDPGPITLTDRLPNGMHYVSARGTGAHCTAAAGTVTCVLDGALAVGATIAVTLEVGMDGTMPTSVTNTVVAASPTEQLDSAVLSATATTAVAAAPPLASTGSDGLGLAAVALLLVALGLGTIAIALRRRRRTN
jgi:uncharacterized repeat protein (TIGR01451 family)